VGTPGFSAGEVEYVSFAGDPNGSLYVGYQDKGDNYKGVVKKGTFSGNWEELYKTTDLGNASVTVNDSGVLFAAFGENNYQPSIKKYISGNWVNINGFSGGSFTSPPQIRTFRSDSLYLLQISNGNVYKYTGSEWIDCNIIGYPTAGNVSLFVRQDTDIPYAAFSESNKYGYVKKYINDENPYCDYISNPAANQFDTDLTDQYGNLSLGFWTGDLTPIVANRKSNGDICVKKFVTGASPYWATLGENPIGYCDYYIGVVSLSVVTTSISPPKGKVYVAFRDGNNGGKVTLKACDIDSPVWETVGGGPASAGAAEYINLIVLNNVPYIAYKDHANGGKITVRKYE